MNKARRSWIWIAVVVCTMCSSAWAYRATDYNASGNWDTDAKWADGLGEPDNDTRARMYYDDNVTVTMAGEVAGSLYLHAANNAIGRTPTLNISSGDLTVQWIDNPDDPDDMPSYMRNYAYIGLECYRKDGSKGVVNLTGGSMRVYGETRGASADCEGHIYISEASAAVPTSFRTGTLALNGYSKLQVTGSGIDLLQIDNGGLSINNSTVSVEFIADADGVRKIDVSAAGTVTLRGSLAVDLSALATSPESIVLIDNAGTDAISGTFSVNAPEGTVYAAGTGRKYALRYAFDAGGDGYQNDVALELLPPQGTMLSVK